MSSAGDRRHGEALELDTDTGIAAAEPPEARGVARDGVRLLVGTPSGVTHTHFDRLADHLNPGDLLVVNTSATVPGQLDGWRRTGPVVVHVANRLADGSRVVELRSAPAAAAPVLDGAAGETVRLTGGGRVRLVAPYPGPGSSPTTLGNRLWRARLLVPGAEEDYLAQAARPISYGYLSDRFGLDQYQTVFARHAGSAEMPSAARPFTPELVTRLVAGGVLFGPVVLHTGVSSQEAGEGPQQEWCSVPATTAGLVNAVRGWGGRVIAVGTTATRAVETAADPDGVLRAFSGWTDLVISPERPPRAVDGLITGWHDPGASHRLLVEAVAGTELTRSAYAAALADGYRWHEFGDSCLLLPAGEPASGSAPAATRTAATSA